MQEIIIAKQAEGTRTIALVENGKLQEVYEESDEKVRLEGNIYLGKVKDVLVGMQAAFVDIGEGKNTFIHLKDIIPKMNDITGNKNESLENYNIKDYIKPNMNLMVQVKKDSNSNKGARVTTHIHIPGRFVVLMPKSSFITVSQKIEQKEERDRLKEIGREELEKQKGYGLIIRTAAEGRKKEDIQKDIQKVIRTYQTIIEQAENLKNEKVPCVLLKHNSIVDKILLDLVDNGLNRVIVNEEETFQEVKENLQENNLANEVKVEYRQGYLLDLYDIDDQIEKAKNRKIWLKCGGFITIDKTEALTAIDVNSGKFIGEKEGTGKRLEQTVLKVNQEASIEIAKQLRLKDIGGIIIIDYIDMQEEESKKLVIQTLQENLKKDRAKTQIMQFTQLNLLEMTRKHIFSN